MTGFLAFRNRYLIIFALAELEEERRKRRKSRWGNEEKEKSFILGMPTVLPTNLSKEQEEAYLCKYQHNISLISTRHFYSS